MISQASFHGGRHAQGLLNAAEIVVRKMERGGITVVLHKKWKIVKVPRLLAKLGIVFLIIVVLTHVAERWHYFPQMGWGLPNSPGHYIDLASAILGIALLVAALIWRLISN